MDLHRWTGLIFVDLDYRRNIKILKDSCKNQMYDVFLFSLTNNTNLFHFISFNHITRRHNCIRYILLNLCCGNNIPYYFTFVCSQVVILSTAATVVTAVRTTNNNIILIILDFL